MTKKDQIISLFLPAVVVLFVYFWFVNKPFQKDFIRERETHERFNGMDEEGFRMQNRTLTRNVEAAKENKKKVLAEINLARKQLQGSVAQELPPEVRLRQLFTLVDTLSLRLLSAKRTGKPAPFTGSYLPADLSARSCWTFQLQGSYPQIQKLLQTNQEKGLSIPFSLKMSPSVETGKATEWILQCLI